VFVFVLKKKVDELKTSEDRVKQLKRPNAASTVKLDNKLRQRQRDSLKVFIEINFCEWLFS